MSRRSAKRQTKRVTARAAGPSVNASSIELALILFMSMYNPNSEESRKRLSVIKREIARHEAESALEVLIKAGCERGKLLQSLALSCGRPVDSLYDGWFTKPGPLSLETLFGLKSREFTSLKEQLLHAADRVDAINCRFEFGILLTAPHLKFFQALPRLLHGYVSLLALAAERLGRGTYIYHNLARAILILYVKDQTGRSHEPEVCTLLGAVNDDPDYDVIKHREWLKEHSGLLTCLSAFVPIFSSADPESLIRSLNEN